MDEPFSIQPEAFRKYLKNTAFLFGERSARLGLNFIVGLLIIRALGPEQFGFLSYVVSLIGLFTGLSTFGTESILPRELVRHPDRHNEILGSAFVVRLAGAAVAILGAVAAVFILDESSAVLAAILLLAVGVPFQAAGVIELYLHASVQARQAAFSQFTALIASSGIRVVFLAAGGSAMAFVLATAVESILLALAQAGWYRSLGLRPSRWRPRMEQARSLLRDSWPLALSSLAVMVYMRVDQVMIKNLLGEEQVGWYAAGVRISEVWYFLPTVITTSVYPALVRAKIQSEGLYLNRLGRLYALVAWIAAGIAGPLTLFAPWIVVTLFGEAYLPSAPVLMIYSWAGIAAALGVASSQYLITENLVRISLYRTVIGMLMNIALNIVLIPRFGITGAAWATLISYTAATCSLILFRGTRAQIVLMTRSLLLIDIAPDFFRRWQSRQPKS